MTLARAPFALLLAALALLAGGCGDEQPPERPFGAEPAKTKNVADVKLDDVTESDRGGSATTVPENGDLTLVYFGFTACPDVCPTTLADLATAIRSLPEDQRKRVTVAMISVDPERDTGKTMRSYLGHFYEQNPWMALRTDDKGLLSDVEHAFGASHELGKKKRDGSYDVSHSAYTYVVDESGEVVLEWPFGIRSQEVAHDLKLLLD